MESLTNGLATKKIGNNGLMTIKEGKKLKEPLLNAAVNPLQWEESMTKQTLSDAPS